MSTRFEQNPRRLAVERRSWGEVKGLLRRFKSRRRRGRKMVRILGVNWTAVGRSLAFWILSRKKGVHRLTHPST
eukprot:scaffold2519_cov124-Cylindrotheca_fusiformis.AAC.3